MVAALAGVALALVVLPACGGNEASPEQRTAPAPTATVTGAEEPEGPQPTIVVEKPKPGDEVSSPFAVSGTANVFEANVIVRVVDQAGEDLYSGFTTATCGSGCRGDFATEVEFRVRKKQRGTLVVSDEDADGDGEPQHEVSVPVILVPRKR